MVWTERTSLAKDLWRYGEDELWKRVYLVPKGTMDKIGWRADHHLTYGEGRSDGSSMMIAKALALATVEVLEGSSRPLRRPKRRPEREFPGHPRFKSFIARRWFDRHATRARRTVERRQQVEQADR